MQCRFRFISYVALTMLAFATVGRAPRMPEFRAQNLPEGTVLAAQASEQ